MVDVNPDPNLREAASYFLAGLPPGESGVSQQAIYKFIRWFGLERSFSGLTPAEIANFAERLSLSDTDYLRKLELIRAFLFYAKKKGWSKANLATHLKSRKGKTRSRSSSQRSAAEIVVLTKQGYAELEAELVELQSKRFEAIEEIRRAAADKDFRENVPLHAARERRGQLEGRIMTLEATLKSAVTLDKKDKTAHRISIGDRVLLYDLDSGAELHYMLVSPREVDPAKGKISNASPIGKAVIGKNQGEVVEIAIPAGKLRCQIKQIER